ncbi:MAG: Flp pilus assembly complex ATPase component TadA [Verrucomicrobia bacterium]|nr:Flp pilus assembly complex ATPase component TadA [Verrucomicrobiota bacterium]
MKEGPKQRSHAVNLAERLVEKGVLTEEQMRLALREQERRKLPLRRIVVDLGLVSPEKLAKFLAEEAHAELVDLNRYAIDFSVFDVVPPKVCRQLVAVPFDRGRRTLRVAMADPLDVEAVDTLRQISGMDVEVYAAPEPDIMTVLERRETAEDVQEVVDELIREEMRDRVLEPSPEDVVDAEEGGGTAPPIIQLVNRIIMRAIEDGASDIHFEPQSKYFRVRMRIDGVLSSDLLIPKGLQYAVTARLKILGNMDVAETRLPQDGRATVLMARRLINLRLSSLPSSYGENLVIRILDTASQLLSIQNLGLAAETQKRLWEIIHKPYGVLIVTGPTGSGKTTTLYSILNELNTPERSIFTLEDPIEFRMQGLCQTEVREDIGLTFEAGLRSLLRQDPDIILGRDARHRDGAADGARRVDGPFGLHHFAHQRRGGRDPPVAGHGRGKLSPSRKPPGHPGPAPGAQALRKMQGGCGQSGQTPRAAQSSGSGRCPGVEDLRTARLQLVPSNRLSRPSRDLRAVAGGCALSRADPAAGQRSRDPDAC